ncbi:hypothetical protein JK202_04795 [Gluconobacter sp. Dm-62]|uniref:hypothetical protein n=1 Tax=Gluconobacter sp. Dm-62 TaxID=2799804 RepID=UPI001B8BE397|nr:hypothetical protein [Gluconobacter sp. Dm-62]MBS1102338.1 hypothetical protein [Gluconobacter sp. Dm-62]
MTAWVFLPGLFFAVLAPASSMAQTRPVDPFSAVKVLPDTMFEAQGSGSDEEIRVRGYRRVLPVLPVSPL